MKLPEYLKANAIGLREFGRLSGIHYATLSRICIGKHRPNARNLNRISGATDGAVSYADFDYPED